MLAGPTLLRDCFLPDGLLASSRHPHLLLLFRFALYLGKLVESPLELFVLEGIFVLGVSQFVEAVHVELNSTVLYLPHERTKLVVLEVVR